MFFPRSPSGDPRLVSNPQASHWNSHAAQGPACPLRQGTKTLGPNFHPTLQSEVSLPSGGVPTPQPSAGMPTHAPQLACSSPSTKSRAALCPRQGWNSRGTPGKSPVRGQAAFEAQACGLMPTPVPLGLPLLQLLTRSGTETLCGSRPGNRAQSLLYGPAPTPTGHGRSKEGVRRSQLRPQAGSSGHRCEGATWGVTKAVFTKPHPTGHQPPVAPAEI